MEQYKDLTGNLVNAEQWDGSDESSHSIIKFCPKTIWFYTTGRIVLYDINKEITINVNDWIVKKSEREFSVLSPEDFNKNYTKNGN